jgi:hypothetical protein
MWYNINMKINTKSIILTSLIFIGLITLINIFLPNKAFASSFNPNNIISDGAFINIDAMNASSIQRFLESQNSYLKDFSEGGRSAAQIIYDASHGYNSASGTMGGIAINSDTGTVSPQVILVTLQKEQGLLSKSTKDDGALSRAMGYACPDSGGCSSTYAGFTKQVENAAWQLRYNFERAQGKGFSDYQVDQTINVASSGGYPNMDVTFSNRATASLYRYTPHVYFGNYNFWNMYYNTYSFQDPEFGSSLVSQNSYPEIFKGDSYNFQVTFRNSGRSTWTKDSVFLGTSRNKDRISQFIREGDGPSGWSAPNRIQMQQNSVAPGQTATFNFWLKTPNGINVGTYREYFQMVAENITWMEDTGLYWDIKVQPEYEKYHYNVVSQNSYPSITPGEGYNYILTVRNSGAGTWQKGQVNLGTDKKLDRITPFIRNDINNPFGNPSGWGAQNRIQMQENSVAPGQTATFSFWMSAPYDMKSSVYKEYFRLVAENVTWMEDYGIYWDVTVGLPHAKYVGQSNFPTLHAGQNSTAWVDYQNTGTTPWKKDGYHAVNLGTDKQKDRSSIFTYSDWKSNNRISTSQAIVNPGETGRFSFTINVPDGTAPGVYQEYFRPVAEGLGWLEDYGVYIAVTVN